VQTILAVDPGTKSGWAVLRDRELLYRGLARIVDVHDYASVVREADSCGAGTLVIETQAFHKNVKNPKTVMRLVQIRAYWECLALRRGLVVQGVGANQWQSVVIGSGNSVDRAERKRRAQARVKALFGVKVTQDEADAICIGIWAMGRE
jgi:Holliday junction resolvasome RuvABC endonuclease subunit